MARLKNKVVIILGASEEGSMGAATAKRFVEEGAKLILAARRMDKVKAIANTLGAEACACDITSESDIEALAQFAMDTFGQLDVAVNFSGLNSASSIDEVTQQALLDSCNVHLIGSTLFIKHMAKKMTNGGSIVTASSLTALLAPPGLAAYAATKKAVDQVVRIAAVEYGPKNIRVNAVAPGFTRSAMTEGYFDYPSIPAAFIKETPLGRLGTVEDIANATLWLASDEAFVTGQIIDVSGGQSLRRTPTEAEMMGG